MPLNRAISDGLSISASGSGALLGLYCRRIRKEDTAMKKYFTGESITIGREDSEIVLDDHSGFVSERHCMILRRENGYFLKDFSKNGTYVNGRQILNEEIELQTGDVLSLACGFKLAFYGEYCAANSGPFLRRIGLRPLDGPPSISQGSGQQPPYTVLSRPPLFFHAISPEKYQLEPVPVLGEENKPPLLLTLGPSLTMSVPMLMGSFLAGTGGYARSGVIMMVTSSALAVTWGTINHFYAKYQRKKNYQAQINDYLARLNNLEQDVEETMQAFATEMQKAHPSAEECSVFLQENSEHIWQNTPRSEHFLSVRLGLGMIKMPCEVVVPNLKMGERPEGVSSAPYQAAERLNKLYRAPVCVSLSQANPIGIVCPSDKAGFVQSLILQIAALNSYMDCRIAVFGREESAERWRWMRHIPH
ncbi:MAG: FHA domain-containing protein, partial [Eubacteriales bacterium]